MGSASRAMTAAKNGPSTATLVGKRFAKRMPLLSPTAHFFQRDFSLADEAHAMVNASRAEATLGNLEAATLAEENVLCGHAYIVEQDLAMAVWRIAVSEDGQ